MPKHPRSLGKAHSRVMLSYVERTPLINISSLCLSLELLLVLLPPLVGRIRAYVANRPVLMITNEPTQVEVMDGISQ